MPGKRLYTDASLRCAWCLFVAYVKNVATGEVHCRAQRVYFDDIISSAKPCMDISKPMAVYLNAVVPELAHKRHKVPSLHLHAMSAMVLWQLKARVASLLVCA